MTTAPVPDTLEEVMTPAWLTAALGARYPGLEVIAVTPGPVISRVSTVARFHIECAGGTPAGLSPDLCVKGYFTEVGRAFRAVGEPEACFYRDVAAMSGMRTPRCVYAEVDPATRHGVVITEDVAVRGARFLDARSEYTTDQAAESLSELVKLHTTTWQNPTFADDGRLAPRFAMYLLMRGVDEIRANFDGPIGAGVPPEVRDADRLVAAYRVVADRAATAQPWSVIHGDAHVGNVYLDPAGRPSFVDWQLVQRGPWCLDVGYHLASALTVEDRRCHERDLVRHYLDGLASAGIHIDTDDAWAAIRLGILHGFYLWGITLKVDPAVTTVLLERLGTAAADHDAFAAVAT